MSNPYMEKMKIALMQARQSRYGTVFIMSVCVIGALQSIEGGGAKAEWDHMNKDAEKDYIWPFNHKSNVRIGQK